MRERLFFLLKAYLWTVLVFVIAKVCFLFYNQANHDFTFGDVADIIWHGLTLDLSVALYIIVIPLLFVIISLWVSVPRWIVSVYWGIISLALSLAFVADSCLYPFWGFKLNATCLQYLETPKEAFASVSVGYIFLSLFAVIVLMGIVYWMYPKTWIQREKGRKRVLETFFYICLMPFVFIGIRGGVDESTTNVGQVYYSQNLFFNHAAVNPIFSFVSSFEHGEKDYYHYNYFEDDVCESLIKDVYTTESVNVDTLLNTQRPNIIVILLESCGAVFTQLGGNTDVMPHFNQIASEGICFTHCYANSWRTDRGTVCTLSGWPSFPSASVMKMPDKSQTMPSIAKTLKQEHYDTHYLYGGDINFTNMRGYLVATGWNRLTSMNDYSADEQKTSQWGVHDDITFETLYQMATTAQSPFLIGYSTLSSHEPWKVSVSRFDDKILNAFSYLDQCIGNFIERIKVTPVWNNLLIVLLADHGIPYKDLDETKPLRNLIPVVWTGGAVREPRKIDQICNQSDIVATLLGQMALNHDDFTFSRDVLSSTYRYPTAVHNYNNAQSMIDSTGFILYDFDADQFLKQESRDADRMLNINKAILQKTTEDLKQR